MTIKTHAVKKGRIPLKHEVNAFELAGDMFQKDNTESDSGKGITRANCRVSANRAKLLAVGNSSVKVNPEFSCHVHH